MRTRLETRGLSHLSQEIYSAFQGSNIVLLLLAASKPARRHCNRIFIVELGICREASVAAKVSGQYWLGYGPGDAGYSVMP